MKTMRSFALPAVASIALLAAHAAGGQPFLWWEGEAPQETNFPDRSAFSPATDEERGKLSQGQWLSSDGRQSEILFASYRVDVPQAGTYDFWVRKFWKHGPFRWRFDDAPWRACSKEVALADNVTIRHLVCANWVHLGKVELPAGSTTLRIELSGNDSPACFDCFVLTREAFIPRGRLKPGGKYGLADPGTWAFEPDADTFSQEALLDLRGLNERAAGESGFVRVSDDGSDFLLGDGTPVRFWTVNTFMYRNPSMEALKAHARFLAKRGVNCVKFHDYPYPKGAQSKITDVDEKVLDWCWRLVAAMKEAGIYTIVSPYWSTNVKRVPTSWGIKDWPEEKSPQGLVYFDQRLQEGYKAWMRAMFTRENPYTGIPLARDPAVAATILQTEDSMLFWTTDHLPEAARLRLGRKFGQWLVGRQGSIDAASKAWGGAGHKDDRFADGVVGLMTLWDLSTAGREYRKPDAGMQRRLADQLHFYADTMRRFNAEMIRFYREELGCRWPIIPGNWKTADQARLLGAERWSYLSGEAMAVQRYTGPIHVNPKEASRAGYAIDEGDYFAERSVLHYPHKLPIAVRQVAGKTFLNTESTWVSPTAYQAEGPFLIATYGSLLGIDGYTFFATSVGQFNDQMTKFQVANPALLGGFPAAALIYRKGYVRQAEPAVVEQRSLDSIWRGKRPLLVEGTGFDPFRDRGDEGFLVGPVVERLGAEADRHEVADLARCIDRGAKIVRSLTGQVRLDYGQGVCTVDAPEAQGVCGFLAGENGEARTFALTDLTIESGNRHAAVLAVPLDDRPLATSERVLVQVGTICRPHGWRTEPAEFEGTSEGSRYQGRRITSLGGPPWNVERAEIEVSLASPNLTRAVRLDTNGMPAGAVPLESFDGVVRFRFPPDALYVVCRAQ
jgi:hypothetical protein